MSIRDNSDPQPGFTRLSDIESICNCCCNTIKTNQYGSLEIAGDIHMDLCLLQPDSPLSNVLW
jgi:hypothetical protein